ncbi:CoB--CoM heterodisulfide reductase iron-sulfur subunit A family protein [Desulfospira joergensenii]|uniref:CoB--CoM heterodisulfide reductase iron-sulfur subunit A family protein n=1 Tax=Desulfospira joergensenii TaxID=53329 RepID=UPI00042637D8|nr:CoB--CoM heterodisulfide reductase iron-sulfur subunit A family protein [Desulfospira joergensenii]
MIKENLKSYEEPRIGVFVCDCGSNIAGHLDCSDVTEYASTLPHVVYAKENLYTCSESGIVEIKKAITEQNLNRVLVASCSPRTHHPLFSSSCAEAGLNPYLFEMVNIRDQCSWVHMGKREDATEKAKYLIRMGVAKAAGLEPQEEIESSLIRKILVIGGGVAGLSAAQALADMELDVILVEKSGNFGGLLQSVGTLDTGETARDFLDRIIQDVKSRSNITCHTGARVKSTGGYIGNYEVKLETDQGEITEKIGSMVVATGAVPLIPEGIFGYGDPGVISLMELEQNLKNNSLDQAGFKGRRMVFIQCAGARTEKKEYCSRICCMTAVKNAMAVKEKYPLADVRVLYRDMQMYGTHKEQMLWDARGKGVRFDVYSPENPPRVENGKVSFFQAVTGETLELDTDLVVLSTPLVPRKDAGQLANMLRVPTDQNGFFLEAHAKLRPLDFAADGIFVAGSGRYPATSTEARTQGIGVAARVAAILFKEKLVKSAIVAQINPDSCVGCLACLPMCPYGAISFNREKRICEVNEILCKGCGNCAATCPSHSAQLRGYKPEQLLAQIGAA